jgi:molybdopterin molybdotransferase
VLPFEQAECDGERVLALGEVIPRKQLGEIGEDVRAGDAVYQAGRRLRPQDVGMLSALGFDRISVVRRPRVRVLITGDELLPMGTPPEGCRITDANGPMLAALVARDGGESVLPPIVHDDRDAIFSAMREEADVLLVSGGSSVGQEDHVPTLLAEHGELVVHGVAMRPSSPAGMGRLDGRLVFLLPGNPVSCLCAYDFFAGRAIRALGGLPKEGPYRSVKARLSRKLSSVVGRVDYARVKVYGEEAEPLAIGGASVLSSVTQADGFVVIPANSEGYAEGASVEVFLY